MIKPMTKPTALIVDDEKDLLSLLSITLRRMGVESVKAENVTEAKSRLDKRQFDLCLTDLRLPDGSGMDIVRHIQAHHNTTPVAVITAFGDPKTAVEALKLGAFDYIAKPIEVDQLESIVANSIRLSQPKEPTTQKTNTAPPDSGPESPSEYQLLGDSEAMQKVRTLISKVARNQAPVLIHGETGTGKELVARLIHEQGPRRTGPFIAINCGAIPRDLMESEFFGHKKGSFTGAFSDKQGLFEAANEGTLFLDEVAELPLDLQVKLLRAIQEKKVRPVGDTLEKTTNIRLISATHRNLHDMINNGLFRQDFYYRINVIPIEIPSLRKRPEDIPVLIKHFINTISARTGIVNPPNISEQALLRVSRYEFKGNVRELENTIERALALLEGKTISPEDIDLLQRSAKTSALEPSFHINQPIEQHLEEVEKKLITRALTESEGNITKAASLLGTTFRSLRYRIKKLHL